MKYPGGVTRNELESRLRAIEASLRRLLVEASGEVRSVVAQAISTALDSVTWDGIAGRPSEFPAESHTHAEADVTDLDKYTRAEVDALLVELAATLAPSLDFSRPSNSQYTSLLGG